MSSWLTKLLPKRQPPAASMVIPIGVRYEQLSPQTRQAIQQAIYFDRSSMTLRMKPLQLSSPLDNCDLNLLLNVAIAATGTSPEADAVTKAASTELDPWMRLHTDIANKRLLMSLDLQKLVAERERMAQTAVVESIDGDPTLLPTRKHETDSGCDLRAAESGAIRPGETIKVVTGLRLRLPPGYEAQVRPRSGLSTRGIMVAFGTVDNEYRGEIGVTVTNLGLSTFTFNRGDRIAQLVVARLDPSYIQPGRVDVDTERGANGFGSSGISEPHVPANP